MTASSLPRYLGENLCAIWQNKDDMPNISAMAEKLYRDIFRPTLTQEAECLFNVWKASKRDNAVLFDTFATELAAFKSSAGVMALSDFPAVHSHAHSIATACLEKRIYAKQIQHMFTDLRVKINESLVYSDPDYLNKRMETIAYNTGNAIRDFTDKLNDERGHSEILEAWVRFGEDGPKSLITRKWIGDRKEKDTDYIAEQITKYAVEQDIRLREMVPPPSPALPEEQVRARIRVVAGLDIQPAYWQPKIISQ